MSARHGELAVWREGVALLAEILQLVERLPAADNPILGDRLVQAASAVPARIAEGQDLGDRSGFLERLEAAREAIAELGALLAAAEQLGRITPDELAVLEDARAGVAAPLRGLIARVRRDLAILRNDPESGASSGGSA